MLYEEIASSIKNWLKGMTKVYYEVIVREDKEKIKQSLDSVKKLKIKRKTFSSYHLFEGSLINECEKAFILFNLGKIQTIKLIETILPKENIVGNLQMHSCDFIMKIKADLIESFWELKGEGNRIVEKILNKTKYIDEKVLDFFKINRKCRSNLHYKNYKELSDTDKENLCKYQDEYLKIVISVFRSELKLKTSWGFELYE